MTFPTSIFDFIRWLTAAAMLAGVLSGMGLAGLFLIRRTQPNRWSNWLFAGLVGAMSTALLDKFFNFTLLAQRFPKLSFLPLNVSFLFAPLLFFYVKSRLYPHFDMNRSDFKHFILPTVQLALLLFIPFSGVASKADFDRQFFTPFSGNFEKGVFILQFFLYSYFAYRFILHEKFSLAKLQAASRQHQATSDRRQVLVVGWLKRMVKTLFILFGVHAFLILTDYFSFRLFDLNLQSKSLFSSFYELSFAAMLAWLCVNGYFALRRRL